MMLLFGPSPFFLLTYRYELYMNEEEERGYERGDVIYVL